MRFQLLFVMSCVFMAGNPLVGEVDTDAMLHSIAAVESNHSISVIGRKGERSQYQFMRSTWVMHSSAPFRLIGQPNYQDEVSRVAIEHVEFIKTILAERGMRITAYNIALAWNGGPNKTRYTSVNRDYASRVENLYLGMVSAPVVVIKTEPPPIVKFELRSNDNRIVFHVPGIIARVQPPYRIAGF